MDINKLLDALSKILSERENVKITLSLKEGDSKCP